MRTALLRSTLGRLAFTLVELMVATAITAVILLLILGITQQTTDAWKNSAAKIESFQGARAAFEAMTRRISQATLNTYYDYFDSNGNFRSQNLTNFVPYKYGRNSDLHLVTGKNLLHGSNNLPQQVTHSIFFQAPMGFSEDTNYKGMDSNLNGCGYFVEFSKDFSRPAFLDNPVPTVPDRYRYRLMQFVQPTEKLQVYNGIGNAWFTTPLNQPAPRQSVQQLADNIVALVILPKRTAADEITAAKASLPPLAADYEYDSRQPPAAVQSVKANQLPPLVEIVMVAVDEPSFMRLVGTSTAPPVGIQQALLKYFASAPSDLALDADIVKFQDEIQGLKLKYQVFRTEVPIRAAKWSE